MLIRNETFVLSKNNGKQTPMRGHPVFIAQHATATCCRGCLKKWYKIEKGRALTEDEIGFVVDLVMGWIEGEDGRHWTNPCV